MLMLVQLLQSRSVTHAGRQHDQLSWKLMFMHTSRLQKPVYIRACTQCMYPLFPTRASDLLCQLQLGSGALETCAVTQVRPATEAVSCYGTTSHQHVEPDDLQRMHTDEACSSSRHIMHHLHRLNSQASMLNRKALPL